MIFPGQNFLLASVSEVVSGAESVYSVPQASDMLAATDLDTSGMFGRDVVKTNPLTLSFSNGRSITVARRAKIAFSIPVASVGDSASALPAWSRLLRSAGLVRVDAPVAALHPSTIAVTTTGTTARATTAAPHGLKNGATVYVTGGLGAGVALNTGTTPRTGAQVRVVSSTAFEYAVTGAPPGNYALPGTVSVTWDTQWLARKGKTNDAGQEYRDVLSLAWYQDTNLHAIAGAAATASLAIKPGAAPAWRFEVTGFPLPSGFVTVGQSPAGVDWVKYLATAPDHQPAPNCSDVVLHGLKGATTPVMHEFAFDLGNELTHSQPANFPEGMVITNRNPGGSMTISTPSDASLATLLSSCYHSDVLGVVGLTQTSASGQRFSVLARYAQLGEPRYGEVNKVATMAVPINPLPQDGDDEFAFFLS